MIKNTGMTGLTGLTSQKNLNDKTFQEGLAMCLDPLVTFGVKQVPIDALQRDKTFCFFSHTIKVRMLHI